MYLGSNQPNARFESSCKQSLRLVVTKQTLFAARTKHFYHAEAKNTTQESLSKQSRLTEGNSAQATVRAEM